MTSRREVLKAAAALPLVTGATRIVDAAVRKRIVLHVLVDERHAAARRVGSHLASRGATVHTIPDGDITQVWLRQIAPAWRREPVAVAGLTERPALFCLEQFALACGLRVVFHNEHVVHSADPTEHGLLRGARAAGLCAADLTRARSLWPERIAEAIETHRAHPSAQVRFGRSDAALAPALPPGATLLTSWIVAAG
jgi:hypothetical protein